jgi:hypothetical protein
MMIRGWAHDDRLLNPKTVRAGVGLVRQLNQQRIVARAWAGGDNAYRKIILTLPILEKVPFDPQSLHASVDVTDGNGGLGIPQTRFCFAFDERHGERRTKTVRPSCKFSRKRPKSSFQIISFLRNLNNASRMTLLGLVIDHGQWLTTNVLNCIPLDSPNVQRTRMASRGLHPARPSTWDSWQSRRTHWSF